MNHFIPEKWFASTPEKWFPSREIRFCASGKMVCQTILYRPKPFYTGKWFILYRKNEPFYTGEVNNFIPENKPFIPGK